MIGPLVIYLLPKASGKVSFDITALRRESPESEQKFQYREC